MNPSQAAPQTIEFLGGTCEVSGGNPGTGFRRVSVQRSQQQEAPDSPHRLVRNLSCYLTWSASSHDYRGMHSVADYPLPFWEASWPRPATPLRCRLALSSPGR